MKTQTSIPFWQARFAQAFLIFVGITAILPVIWRVIAAFMARLAYPVDFSFSAVLLSGIYMPSLVTGAILACVIALRSATWGEVTWRFMLGATFLVSLVIDLLIRYFGLLGFGTELFFLWMLSWLFTGIIGYGLLRLSALDQRYKSSERPLLLHALWIVVVYGIYVPTFYTLLKLAIIYDGDQMAYLAGRQEFIGTLEPASFLMVVIIALGLVAKLRRGQYSMRFFFLWPLGVIFSFFVLHLFANGFEHLLLWFWFYLLFALLSIGFSNLLLALLNHLIKTNLTARNQKIDHKKFTFIIFIILALISVPLWQSLTIIWRSILFGFPPASFFMAQLHMALMSGIVFFALPCACYAWIKQRLDFSIIFIVALFASFVSSFLPAGHLGIPLGFLFDHLFWQMLIFGPIAIIGWYILSCMPQIQCNST